MKDHLRRWPVSLALGWSGVFK